MSTQKISIVSRKHQDVFSENAIMSDDAYDIEIFSDKYRGQFFTNTTDVNIPEALRARAVQSFEGRRKIVEVYCESGYNTYYIDGELVKLTKPEDLPAGCKFEYYTGNPVHKWHESGFWEIRRFIGRYTTNLKQYGVYINYKPGDDSCMYLGNVDEKAYWVRLFDGFYDEEELATAKLDGGELYLHKDDNTVEVIEEGSEVVDGVKYHYQICSTPY